MRTGHGYSNRYPQRRAGERAPRVAPVAASLGAALVFVAVPVMAQDGRQVIAQGAEVYGPVTPVTTAPLRSLAQEPQWEPGDPIREVPRRFFPVPGQRAQPAREGLADPLLDRQVARAPGRAPSITVGVNVDGQGFTGASPPDTVADVGPSHFVQAVNASRIAVYDKSGALLPGYPIDLDSLAPSAPCTGGGGDPIVLYDWLADRWLLQEFTSGGTLCLYVSTTADPTGTYHFYAFNPPSFPDYPHYGVWPDAYYAATNEAGPGGNQTTYAFDRVNMLAGNAATMQRLAAVPPLSGYGFQTLTPADHDGSTAPPAGAPGIFMRHRDDEAHTGGSSPTTDQLEMWEMSVDFVTPGNTTLTALPSIAITDFNSWMINYTTFYSTAQPGSGTLLDAIREVIMQRLVYRNFGTHETLLGVFATNRDPATSGSTVQQGLRWFELRRSGGDAWSLHDEGTYGGDTNSTTANFFMGSVAMDRQGDIALGYSKTDVGGSPVFPSIGYAGRLSNDAAGTLGPENIAVPGGGASSAGGGRWGDYASLSIDPADDCTFWMTNEYIPGAAGSWGTRITSFLFDACGVGFTLSPTPSTLNVCAATDPDPTVSVGVTATGGWSFPVTLAASGTPPGTSSSFSPNAQTPNFTSTHTLSGAAGSTSGTYNISITGTGGDAPATVRNTKVVLTLAVSTPGAAPLSSPANGAAGVSTQPTLSWQAAPDAATYGVQVATDAGFTNVVYSVTGLTGLSHTLPTPLASGIMHYWRVTATNTCGGATSTDRTFSTMLMFTRTFASTDVSKPIPPGPGTSGTTTSVVVVPGALSGTITDVNVVNLVGTHTWMGDLDFLVQSPAGTSVLIREQACSSDDDFNINYDDEAASTPPCPPTDTGTYQPSSALSAFDGENSAGTWTLSVVDVFDADTGQLNSWSLVISVATRGFTDDPVTPSVTIRAVHFTELRARVDALRTAGTLSVFPWTDDPLVAGTTTVQWIHVQELRTALDQAFADRGASHAAYAAGGAGTLVRTTHIMELRQFVVELEAL